LRTYPESIELTPDEVLNWAESGRHAEACRFRFERVARAMLYCPHGVWYRTSLNKNAKMGFRFDVRAEDYMSGFDDMP
jgi:hypothetical protein